MLIIILSIIIIFPVLAGFGEIFQKFLGKFVRDFLLSCFQGIFLGNDLASFCHFLNIWVESISLGIGILAFFYFKSYQNFTSFTKMRF